MKVLSKEQWNQFWSEGFLVVENAVERDLLQAMQDDFSAWVE